MASLKPQNAVPGSPDDMMDTIAALRVRVAKLEAALTNGANDFERRWDGAFARAALSETVEA